jgi:hypothetical protein
MEIFVPVAVCSKVLPWVPVFPVMVMRSALSANCDMNVPSCSGVLVTSSFDRVEIVWSKNNNNGYIRIA